MNQIFVYKMVTEGIAPFVKDGILSLAICKPRIRKKAGKDDLVIGFAANSLNRDNALLYVAKIGENLSNGEYYKEQKYHEREDCIYRFCGGTYEIKPDCGIHTNPGDREHDLGKDCKSPNVLISKNFTYYWGDEAKADYKKEGKFSEIAGLIENLRQGHRVNHVPQLRKQLEQYCESKLTGGYQVFGKLAGNVDIVSCRRQDSDDEGCKEEVL